MAGVLNTHFLLLFFIIVYLFRKRKNLYSEVGNKKEKFTSYLGRNNYLNQNFEINQKEIYTHTYDLNQIIPRIFTNFKYSLEFKLGQELQKIFKIKNQESPGLFQNLINASKKEYSQDLFLVSETDYYRLMENNPKLKEKLGFVTSFYYQHFLLFTQGGLPISTFTELEKISNIEFLPREYNTKKIIIGIPNKKTNSYQDAVYLFNSIGLDITKTYKNIKFIFDTEKHLHSRLKMSSGEKRIHCMYLTTSIRHPYLVEYIQSNQINVISTSSVNQNIIKANYGGNYLFKNRIPKNNFSPIIKKKNIYVDVPDYSLSTRLINNDAETLIIGSSYLDVLSSRVILVAPLTVSPQYVNYLLRNIYASLHSIKKELQDYLFNSVLKNFLKRHLEPYEMSYVNSKFSYHPGSHQFYQEMQFISDKESLAHNILEQ